ncbi:hypothetical protein LEN26_018437 [Aphanomyces euteiches]|nr:hypothetical protein LEN26_018437 [Aphanomyces euteiches]
MLIVITTLPSRTFHIMDMTDQLEGCGRSPVKVASSILHHSQIARGAMVLFSLVAFGCSACATGVAVGDFAFLVSFVAVAYTLSSSCQPLFA